MVGGGGGGGGGEIERAREGRGDKGRKRVTNVRGGKMEGLERREEEGRE